MSELVCWHCGASLAALSLPMGRGDQCASCAADLHVCRLCEFFAPNRSKGCREPVVDAVTHKERANFCDYFRPRPGAFDAGKDRQSEAARNALDALFGAAPTAVHNETKDGREALEDLFKPKDK